MTLIADLHGLIKHLSLAAIDLVLTYGTIKSYRKDGAVRWYVRIQILNVILHLYVKAHMFIQAT